MSKKFGKPSRTLRNGPGQFEGGSWQIGWKTGLCGHCDEVHEQDPIFSNLAMPPQITEEVGRLKALTSLGWNVKWDLYNVGPSIEDEEVCDFAIAYVHIYINGSDAGYGLRVYADDLVTNEEEAEELWKTGGSPSACLKRLIELLPSHITELIEFIRNEGIGNADQSFVNN